MIVIAMKIMKLVDLEIMIVFVIRMLFNVNQLNIIVVAMNLYIAIKIVNQQTMNVHATYNNNILKQFVEFQ